MRFFVSSTVADLGDYRREVSQALQGVSEEAVVVEHLVHGYVDALRLCETAIRDCSGYLGVFAWWYGTIPSPHNVSCTHLEFRWAWDRWKNDDTRHMAVFMPLAGSDAARQLQTAAENLEAGLKESDRPFVQAKLGDFHREVQQPGQEIMTVTRFRDRSHLGQLCVSTVFVWQKRLLAAARKNDSLPPEIAPFDLGSLGRADHVRKLDRLLSDVGAKPEVPAVLGLFSGDEDAGQYEFSRRLLGHKSLRRSRPPICGSPSNNARFQISELIHWLATELNLRAGNSAIPSLNELADQIHAQLKKQELVIILYGIQRLSGGLTRFHDEFWRPLYARLGELRGGDANCRRCVFIALEQNSETGGDPGPICEFAPATQRDFTKFIRLPDLADISEDDLVDWLNALDVPDDPPGRHAQIVNAALRRMSDAETGEGTPQRVFGRLRQLDLWPRDEP